MDTRGMPADFAPVVEFNDRMYGIYTASPGIILAFDGTLATVQISVRMKSISNGVVTYLDPPPVTNVPVVLPSSTGAGVFITVPIMAGDPCLIVFGQRGISNVVNSGGLQNPPDGTNPLLTRIRHHDMADAICIPGLGCKPNTPVNWSMEGIEIRNAADTVFVRVTPSGIQTQGAWQHTGNIEVQGNIVATGSISP